MFYKFIENVFLKEKCNDIIEYCKENYSLNNIGTYDTVSNTSNLNLNFNKRKGIKFKDRYFIDLENKILEILNNDKIFLDIFFDKIENILFNQYNESDFLNYHIDAEEIKYGATLTVVIQLNDDYEGGEFVYQIDGIENILPKIKGSIFIFESSILHKINPITKGIRYSLNLWPKYSKIKINII